jgi:hypothetical protein
MVDEIHHEADREEAMFQFHVNNDAPLEHAWKSAKEVLAGF